VIRRQTSSTLPSLREARDVLAGAEREAEIVSVGCPRDDVTMLLPSQMKRFRTSWVRWYLSTTDVRGSLPIDWAGHRVQQASVVYVVGEGNRGIQKRGYAWKKHYHHAAPACKFIQRPVRILETQDRDETHSPSQPLFSFFWCH
jgi:hypothetical protein